MLPSTRLWVSRLIKWLDMAETHRSVSSLRGKRRSAGLILLAAVVALSGHDPRHHAAGPSTPAGLSHAEWGQIRGLVEEGRYHAAPIGKPGKPAVLRASNPRQGYVTTFRSEGVELESRPALGQD